MLLGLADTIRTLASMSSLKVGKAVILLHLCMVHGLTAEVSRQCHIHTMRSKGRDFAHNFFKG